MRIAFITSGAAGMFCGSCMKDNTLVSTLISLGHDAQLIPTYTPIRTDEDDVSAHRVFFGGINVYLEQKSWLFRHTPWAMDKLLNFPALLRWVSRFALGTQAQFLGKLTVSMLKGAHGNQRKEISKLLAYLRDEVKPDIIVLSNLLISGMVAELKNNLRIPILGTLQGDDIYLESLPAEYREQAIRWIRDNSRHIDGHFVTSRHYADFMANYLGLPREQMHVVYPGIKLNGFELAAEMRDRPAYTIGYFARICPEKGFHLLAEAYRVLKTLDAPPCRLRVSGWLGPNNQKYFDEEMAKLRLAGHGGDVEHVPSPSHADKIAFLRGLDVLSVPTVYREPKGLYILEAMASGVPVVQPRHGSFPELIESTGGGILVEPDDPYALAQGLKQMLENVELRRRLGEQGRRAVHERFSARQMAESTAAVLQRYIERHHTNGVASR